GVARSFVAGAKRAGASGTPADRRADARVRRHRDRGAGAFRARDAFRPRTTRRSRRRARAPPARCAYDRAAGALLDVGPDSDRQAVGTFAPTMAHRAGDRLRGAGALLARPGAASALVAAPRRVSRHARRAHPPRGMLGALWSTRQRGAGSGTARYSGRTPGPT